ncbi:alpha-glucosidase maltase [Rhinocladiella similis]
MGSIATPQKTWWKDAVVYQIWPASFKDSDGDGLGDLKGISDKLDYIRDLGANVIWISPIFDSPQVDLGYDISDYERIYAPYGTMADLEEVIRGCHSRGLRILLDLVINHTSDQHAWFRQSRSSKSSPQRDWYIWRPARYDKHGQRGPPNNWQSMFGGSAWEWDEASQEYYLHLFSRGQPDVNWANPALREAVYNSAIRFWLDKGIDGFRIDTMGLFAKDMSFADAPETDTHSPFNHRPENFLILNEIHDILHEYGELMTVGEFGGLGDTSTAMRYVSAAESRVNMGFQFETVCLGYALSTFNVQPMDLREFQRSFAKWQTFIEGTDGWTTMFLENHDLARSVSRFTSDKPEHRVAAAKVLALLQTAATGTLFVYQGQEIGMTNIPSDWPIEEYKDKSTQWYWESVLKESGDDLKAREEAMDNIRKVARDHSRTPMQWTGGASAGFTTSTTGPWMRINDNYTDINVERQIGDKDSVLSFWKKLLRLRKDHVDLLAYGDFRSVDAGDDNGLVCFQKTSVHSEALVLLNLTPWQKHYRLPDHLNLSLFSLEIATLSDVEDKDSLGPFEGRLYISNGPCRV